MLGRFGFVCSQAYGKVTAPTGIADRGLKLTGKFICTEKFSSKRTEALFISLTLLFFALLVWRGTAHSLDMLALLLMGLSIFFLFYTLNFRTLTIRLSSEALKLRFGIFTWTVPLENIEDSCLDNIPLAMRLGGAGIHFMSIRRRYRASFNFLEYPRIVITFKRKVGPVRDISFSTRQPDELLRSLQEAAAAHKAA